MLSLIIINPTSEVFEKASLSASPSILAFFSDEDRAKNVLMNESSNAKKLRQASAMIESCSDCLRRWIG